MECRKWLSGREMHPFGLKNRSRENANFLHASPSEEFSFVRPKAGRLKRATERLPADATHRQ